MAATWTPATTDVAERIARFTLDSSGRQVGDFTEFTQPNAVQATSLIADATEELAGAVGPIDVTLQPFAKNVAAWGAAATIVMSYYPDPDGLAVPLRAMYDEQRSLLIDAIQRIAAGGVDGAPIDGGSGAPGAAPPATPVGSFPAAPTYYLADQPYEVLRNFL